jgi:hypothetical protein
MGWRDITSAHVFRTSIAAAIPRVGVGHTLPLFFLNTAQTLPWCAFLGNLNALCFDFVVRQKLAGHHLTYTVLRQLPVLSPETYRPSDLRFIGERIIELTYTADDMRAFAEDLGHTGPPFRWDPERRALLRAELDAYYAYLYGLTRRELEYILDPKAVMSEDYPSETFRVLKENEIDEFGEYRTQRLVLKAWDRFADDGTFDPARLRDPQYIDRVADELSKARARIDETERNQLALMTLAAAAPKPTLFVEGTTDVSIIEAAWSVFFPDELIPVVVQSAGGTKEMGSLAGPGKALRIVLGDKTVLALADNDSAGRKLIDDGHIKKGGLFKQLANGVHWCLLKPTDDFAAVMKAHSIPAQLLAVHSGSSVRPVAATSSGSRWRVVILWRTTGGVLR